MFRFVASVLIALVALSSSLAHAHGGSAMDGVVADHNPAHQSETSMRMDHNEGDPTSHEDYSGACVLGHCATACGVILPSFVMASCETISMVEAHYADKSFVGVIMSSDPPPPKS